MPPECQNLTVKTTRLTRRGLPAGPWMVLWTMLVHGFGSILGRFAAVLVFFASCPVSFWSSSDKFLEILGFLLGHSDHSEIFSAILALYPPARADFCSSVLHHLFLTTPCAAASRASDLLLYIVLSKQLLHFHKHYASKHVEHMRMTCCNCFSSHLGCM